MDLEITVPDDAKIQKVDYQITGAGRLHGSIATAQPSSMFSRFVSHVPVGKGYVVQVDATSADAMTTCDGTAHADVELNATTLVRLALTCRGVHDGHIVINVGVQCPDFQIDTYTISPLAASVGGTIAVAATTSETDGGSQAFMWTASSGAFAMPTDSQTTYKCDSPGMVTLTAAASQGACQDSKTATVSCVGDGGVTD